LLHAYSRTTMQLPAAQAHTETSDCLFNKLNWHNSIYGYKLRTDYE